MARAMTRIYENDDEDYINMRPLLRLGIWGICTIAALAAAVIAGRSDAGSERADAALAVLLETPMDVLSHPSSALPARPTEAEAEAQRLAEMVRTLTADRDELAARVATLERNISDLTGTVARERPANPDARSDQRSDAAPSGAAVPAFAPPPVDTAAAVEPRPPVAEPQTGVGTPANVPLPRPGPLATIQSYVSAAAAPAANPTAPSAPTAGTPRLTEAPAGTNATAGTAPPPKDLGLELASATNVNALRARWSIISKEHPALLEGLRPVVIVRESARPGFTEYHLVAGPIATSDTVIRLCGLLVASRVPCRPALFDGQRLELR